jgi:hypothetical protein
MRVTVARQPRPYRGVGDLLQPRTRTAAGDVLEVAEFTTGLEHRKQLTHNIVWLIDGAQHQRAHHRVKRGACRRVFLHGFAADRDGHRRCGGRLLSQQRQPALGLDGDDLGHRVGIKLEVRPRSRADFEDPAG